MESTTPPQARPKLSLRRLLAAALSGGLGVFGLAVETTPANASTAAPMPPATVASVDQPPD
jgi:hypothetical protein